MYKSRIFTDFTFEMMCADEAGHNTVCEKLDLAFVVQV